MELDEVDAKTRRSGEFCITEVLPKSLHIFLLSNPTTGTAIMHLDTILNYCPT